MRKLIAPEFISLGYSHDELESQLGRRAGLETFLAEAPGMNNARSSITGVICGVRVEQIEEPTMGPLIV